MANSTNLNIDPYYDDYNESKAFTRILFKPGVAVQARELTQVQTIIQNQIKRFGQHVFKDGSIVTGGTYTLDKTIQYVTINDLNSGGNSFNINTLANTTITGATTNVRAYVELVANGLESATDKKTLYVRYLSSGNNGTTKVFADGETLTSNGISVVAYSSNATGRGTLFTVEEGSIFSKNLFLYYPKQTIIASRYSTQANVRIGFNLIEDIVDSNEDESLLDPALGASNYFATGADRFRIRAILTSTLSSAFVPSPDYVDLVKITNGNIFEGVKGPDYNILGDELAKRTNDESGDYIVKGLTLRIRENLDNSENNGLLSQANGGNVEFLSVCVDPGVGYVKGYKVNNLLTNYITIPKALTFRQVSEQITTARLGRFVACNEFVGSVGLDDPVVVSLYDKANKRVTNGTYSSGSQTGNVIGSAKIKSIEYEAGVLGTTTGNVNIFLFDLQMLGSNAFSSVKSIYADNATDPDVSADIILTDNVASFSQVISAPMLYYVGNPYTRSIRNSSDSVATNYQFQTTSSVTITAGGTFTLSSSGGEIFPYGSSGTLNTDEKQQIILTIGANRTVNLSRTITATANSNTITSNTSIFNNFNVGDKIQIENISGVFRIEKINSGTSANVFPAPSANISGNAFFKYYLTGDTIDLTTKGVDAGTVRTATIASSSQLNFDLKETFTTTTSAFINYRLVKPTAREIAKTLKPNRFVKIDCATSGTTGPFNLGFSDVYQIRNIRKHSGSFSTGNEGTDVTSQFTFDNGQRDDLYDHAKITPTTTLSSGDYLLVKLDYFDPDYSQGSGYFSVDSYPIDDTTISNSTIQTSEIPVYTSTTNGARVDLRNFLDFRPIKVSTSADATTVGSASSNPATTNSFNQASGGVRIVAPTSEINYDYNYYLGRIDVVTVDRDGNFAVTEGVPESIPVTPINSEDTMAIGKVFVTPYPSISPYYSQILNRRDLEVSVLNTAQPRFTMRDIGVLKTRIENLEYYVALNALEKSAIDLSVTDENGLDRFKNGIFVDSFADSTLSDITNPDYSICLDQAEKCIRPLYLMDSINYRYVSGTNVQKTGDLITLPYTEELFLEQPGVTTNRNVETAVFRFIGTLALTPDTDVWVDTQQAPDNNVLVNNTTSNLATPFGQRWNAWRNQITGFELVDSTGSVIATYGDNERNRAVSDLQAYIADQSRQGRTTSATVRQLNQRVRTGTELFNTTVTNVNTLGNKVIDVSLIPYIRPQIIQMYGQGLKASTKFFTFFDNENMSDYVTPTDSDFIPTGAEGSSVISNDDGEVYALLRLPNTQKQFRTGTKEVKLIDSQTAEEDTTSSARAFFVAQGLLQQKQNDILTTRSTVTQEREASEVGTLSQQNIAVLDNFPAPTGGDGGGDGGGAGGGSDCSAYSFIVKAPPREEGIFLTSFDIYFQAKSAKYGVWFEIREVDNAGGITRNAIPFSEVWVKSANLTVSADASLAQRVTFPAPIFLYNNRQYALAIHTEASNPDSYLWVSKIGQTDIITNKQITSRAYTGTFYTTNNNLNWDMLPDVDLKVKLYRAKFNTAVTGVATLGNKPVESLTVGNASGVLNFFGEQYKGYDQLTVTTPSGGSIVVTNKLTGANSGITANVINISGSLYRTDGRGYIVGEALTVSNTTGHPTGVTTTVATIKNAQGSLRKFQQEENIEIAQFFETGNLFFATDVLKGQRSNITASVDTIHTYPYYLINFEPSFLNFNKTSISFDMRGVIQSSNTYSDFTPVVVGNNTEFSEQRVVLSRSLEESLLSGGASNQTRATLESTSDYLSPVLDIGRTHTVYVRNVINNDDTGETNAGGGSLYNKYISKIITLADGQDAEDLIVYLTAYIPPTTDFKVYAKLLHVEDSNPFSNVSYIELEKTDDTIFSSIADSKDFREFNLKLPTSYMTGPNGEFQYTSPSGVTFTGFKYYQIKIGLLGTDKSIAPKIGDLRAIALQI